ncbi:hypothetical protein DFH94DRAFT_681025 [Russula ochroleuca]|uniref:Uncharacterized protein n=1 Tax=Russula ochroleuca TaxID=152965 RepID=A0A9P5MY21_9AGAM|nr:hypothetical protein DFH94DRAFT_681025 [Russula ochroleuca]
MSIGVTWPISHRVTNPAPAPAVIKKLYGVPTWVRTMGTITTTTAHLCRGPRTQGDRYQWEIAPPRVIRQQQRERTYVPVPLIVPCKPTRSPAGAASLTKALNDAESAAASKQAEHMQFKEELSANWKRAIW